MNETDASLRISHIIRWFVPILLCVFCGCLYANTRARQAMKQQEIRRIQAARSEVESRIAQQRADTSRYLTERILGERLARAGSPLALVGPENMEALLSSEEKVAKRER